MDLHEKKIRDTLLRFIAEKNKKISSYIHMVYDKDFKGYSFMHNYILSTFVGNSKLYTEINELIEKYNRKFGAHNYFDIETLYSYDKYLENILDLLQRAGSSLNITKMGVIIKDVGLSLKKNANTKESGYYNLDAPVKFSKKLLDNNFVLDPRITINEETFEKKYNKSSSSCKREVEGYIEFKKHPELYAEHDSLMKEYLESAEFIDYVIKNDDGENFEKIQLLVKSKENYFDEMGNEVTVYTAKSSRGTLYTTRDRQNQVYNGMLFDDEGEVVDMESGETFYETKLQSTKRSKKEADRTFSKYMREDDFNEM